VLNVAERHDARPDFSAHPHPDVARGQLITGENLDVAKCLIAAPRDAGLCEEGQAATAEPFTQSDVFSFASAPRLVYMDPPFFTGRKHNAVVKTMNAAGKTEGKSITAFEDSWNVGSHRGDESFANYLTMLTARIMAIHSLLADDGVFWLHLDHHATAYAKILTDAVFGGSKHMINEIIWQYKSGGSSSRRFARKHDNLLFYAKDPKRYLFHAPQEQSYNRGRKPYRFKGVKEYRDEGGWYTMVNMRDVWQIDMVGRTAAERTGYATQKPEELLRRIVESCTDEGDLCADVFGGSGTLAAVAAKAGRNWISCDQNPLATEFAEARMQKIGKGFDLLVQEKP
jgi:adenine specific DNA methylase Mod